jgi:hypothetical protein
MWFEFIKELDDSDKISPLVAIYKPLLSIQRFSPLANTHDCSQYMSLLIQRRLREGMYSLMIL